MSLNIIQNYLEQNRCYQRGVTTPKIGIQVHSIGTAQNSSASVAEYWNQPSVSACVHYCVDAETEGKVLKFLPETIRSWADAGYGNEHLVTMEICESDFMRYTADGADYTVTDQKRFQEDIRRGYETALELCVKICSERGWNPLAKLPSGLYLISSHNEGRLAGLSSAHVDPDHVWGPLGLSMDGFRKEVAERLQGEEETFCQVSLPDLRRGDKNRYVKNVQRLLRELGYQTEKGTLIQADGHFGKNTERAVIKFQKSHQLKVEKYGVIEEKTWKKLLTAD